MADEGARRVDEIQGEIIHVYDGIEEADNELPTWWLMTFYGAIAFSMVYWVVYHELHAAELPSEAYASALAERAGDGEEVSEGFLLALLGDPAAVSSGQELFVENCAVCHMAGGQGNIGPNLTDPNWIHGGAPTDIYSSIYHGQLQNGMPAWGPTLGGQSVQRIAAYVLSIRDTNVAGKEPEGEVWVPGAAGEEGSDAETPDAELGGAELDGVDPGGSDELEGSDEGTEDTATPARDPEVQEAPSQP